MKTVARQSFMLEEWLGKTREAGQWSPSQQHNGKVLLHGHCHQKPTSARAHWCAALKELGGFEVDEVDSGCCGMAGSFGFEAEHYGLSMEVGKRRLFKATVEGRWRQTCRRCQPRASRPPPAPRSSTAPDRMATPGGAAGGGAAQSVGLRIGSRRLTVARSSSLVSFLPSQIR